MRSGMGIVIGIVGATLLALACGSSNGDLYDQGGSSGGSSGSTTTTDASTTAGDGINATGVGAGTGANTGLPCDIQQLLENRCIGCHLAGASVPPLLTYDDLLKPAPSDPKKTMAQRSLERMQDTTSPMPPAPAEPPTAAEIQTWQAWVSGGTPKGAACTDTGDGGAPPATNPYATPTVCTSNKTWSGGNDGSGSMRPGGACITCHSMRGGPAYVVAGTVYPTAHEPNDCNGAPGPITVEITDANGAVTTLQANSVGNFYSRAKVAAPFHVKVKSGTKERAMSASLTAGDCNSCHTEQGVNGAPGRVMAP